MQTSIKITGRWFSEFGNVVIVSVNLDSVEAGQAITKQEKDDTSLGMDVGMRTIWLRRLNKGFGLKFTDVYTDWPVLKDGGHNDRNFVLTAAKLRTIVQA